jgi:hypothetical protein
MDILKKLRCPIKRVMALTKYVVKTHDTMINTIWKWTRTAAELRVVLSLNRPNTKRDWTTETVMIRMKPYNKYFLQRTGFLYLSFLRNEPYGDIPHSCEAKCITFKVLRISAIERKSSAVPEQNSKIKRNVFYPAAYRILPC